MSIFKSVKKIEYSWNIHQNSWNIHQNSWYTCIYASHVYYFNIHRAQFSTEKISERLLIWRVFHRIHPDSLLPQQFAGRSESKSFGLGKRKICLRWGFGEFCNCLLMCWLHFEFSKWNDYFAEMTVIEFPGHEICVENAIKIYIPVKHAYFLY